MRRVRGGPLGESMSRQGGAGRKGISWALLAGYASRRWAWEQCPAYAALCQVGRNRGGGASARNAKFARTGVTCPEQRSVQSFHLTIGPRKWWRGGAGVAGGDQRLRGRVWHKGHFCVPRRPQGGLPTPWACGRPPPRRKRVQPPVKKYRGRNIKWPQQLGPASKHEDTRQPGAPDHGREARVWHLRQRCRGRPQAGNVPAWACLGRGIDGAASQRREDTTGGGALVPRFRSMPLLSEGTLPALLRAVERSFCRHRMRPGRSEAVHPAHAKTIACRHLPPAFPR